MKKYKVVLHQEYIVEAANEHEALCWAEQLGLGNEYEIALDTTVEEIEEEKAQVEKDIKNLEEEIEAELDYQRHAEQREYDMLYEPTYDPETGAM